IPAARLLFRELALTLDVDAPTSEPRRQARVLAFLADGERQLESGDDDLGDAGVVVQAHLTHLGRRERAHHEVGTVGAERNDVDLLAAQLVHDLAHAHAARPDAGADRVDVLIVRRNGELGAVTRLARDSANIDAADYQIEAAQLAESVD